MFTFKIFNKLATITDRVRERFIYCFLVLSIHSFAQTGPGGVGNSNGEFSQPTNIIWLDAKSLLYTDGSPILEWKDISGNANNARANVNTSPFFKNVTPLNNGLGYAFFDQVAKNNTRLLISPLNNSLSTSDYSMVFVIRTSDSNDAWLSYATSTDVNQVLVKNSQSLTTTFTGSNSINTLANINNNAWHIVVVQGESSTGNITVFDNGVATTVGVTPGFQLINGGTMWIGHQQKILGGGEVLADAFDGSIAELSVFSDALNPAQQVIITNYLSAKFNIPIASDLYDENAGGAGNYDYQVAGIGRAGGAKHTKAESAGFLVDEYLLQGLSSDGETIMFGHDNTPNTVVTTDLGDMVQERWARDWYVEKTTLGSLGVQISFDFGDGIGGLFPQVADDYVLLRWSGTQYDTVNVGKANKTISGDDITFIVPSSEFITGRYSLGTMDATNSPVDGLANKIWYAYKTGVWTDWQSWTLDGSVAPILNNPNKEKPGPIDRVVIPSGKTITMDSSNFDLQEIIVEGVLDYAKESNHNFNNVNGTGIIRIGGTLSGLYFFPFGDASGFADPDTGGTLEVYGSGGDVLGVEWSFNNVNVNLDNNSDVVVLLADIFVNGDLTIQKGITQIGDDASTTARYYRIAGDLKIEAAGTLSVGTADARHQIILLSDFNNNGGLVNCSNLLGPSYSAESTTGIIDLKFVDTTKDQNLICSGVTNLYRIEINKGDITKVLNITASSTSNFNLWGPSNYDHDITINQLSSDPLLPVNQQNLNALGLYRGTVFVGANVSIPKLSVGASSNYLISKNASIDVTAGTLTKDEGTSITAFGNLNNFGGTINVTAPSGLILKDAGAFRSSDGTTTLTQLTTQVGTESIAIQGQSYVQSGGSVIITGNGGDPAFKNFSLNFNNNSAIVSGGTLRVKGGSEINSRGILIASPDDKLAFTGGTIILENDQGGAFTIDIAGDIWNINLEDSDGTPSNAFTLSNNLLANGDITIFDNAKLTTNAFDVSIGRSFTVNDVATYTTGAANVTRFIGNTDGVIDFKTTPRTINGLTIKKDDPNATVRILSGATNAIQVNGELRVESGKLNLNTFNVIATSNIYIATSLGEETNTGKLVLSGSTPQTITSNEGTLFNVELDNDNGTNSIGLTLIGDLTIAGTLTMTTGVFDIGSNKLTIDGPNGAITGTFSQTRMIMTNGLFGDGGLEWYVDANETILFPIGCDADADGNIAPADEQRYTPASVTVSNFTDDGYIRFIPADGVLTTSKDPDNTLSFSWRVKHSNFSTLPTVRYSLVYDNDDEAEGNWNPPQPAKVVLGIRCQENAVNMNEATRTIIFNGNGTCNGNTTAGFTLESGQYTAAKNNAFTGNLKTLYSWRTSDVLKTWNDPTGWSELPDSYSGNGFPGPADIAIIQSDGNYWHRVATVNNLQVAAVYFDNSNGTPNGNLPQLDILSNNTVTLNEISGEGHIRIRVDPGGTQKLPVIAADIEGVLSEPNSVFEYNATNEAVTGAPTITSGPVANLLTTFRSYPNLYIAADADGATSGTYPFRFTTDITSESLTVYNGGYLKMNGSSEEGDIIVNGTFTLGNNANESILEFNGSGFDRMITINGDLHLTDHSFFVIEDGTASLEHLVRVAQDVNKGATNNFVSKNLSSNAVIIWEMFGAGNHLFNNSVVGDEIQLNRVIINKGVDTNSSFTIDSDFTFTGATNDLTKPVLLLQNGLAIINRATVDVELTSSGEMVIPSTAGLEVSAGRVTTRGSGAIRLDGLLRISGNGIVDTNFPVSTSNVGYIRFSNTGSAQIDLSGNATLNVSGALRRDIESNLGAIIYKQTDNSTAVFAINAAGILTTKGVFEVPGENSSIEYTGGSITIVQGTGVQLVPSLLLTPGTSNITQTITIGNVDTPNGATIQSIGIDASVPLAGLTFDNTSNYDLDALIANRPLEITGDLTIASGTTFDAEDWTLSVGGDFINNGTYLAKTGLTVFNAPVSQQILGSSVTEFYNFTKSGNGTLTLANDILVRKNLLIAQGILADDGYTIEVFGNVLNLAIHTSNTSNPAEGIKMGGTNTQSLIGEIGAISTFGVLTIDNPTGVNVPINGYTFSITNRLQMSQGIFNIGSASLILDVFADINAINPFGNNNMISTNSSFTDYGVMKKFPVGWVSDFIFPMGGAFYNPVLFNFGANDHTSGTTVGSLRVRLASQAHPSVSTTASPPIPSHKDNVLQHFWILDGETLTDFKATATFTYHQSQVKVDDPAYSETDYIDARFLYDENPSYLINKGLGTVDDVANTITLDLFNVTDAGISGDYFAGIDEALPTQLAAYTTISSGNVQDAVYNPAVPGGGAPSGAIVIIDTGHTLTFDVDNISFYATEIRGTLQVQGTYNHRLGDLTGTGTLSLLSDDNSIVHPAAYYANFFSETGGSLIYGGTGNYTVLGGVPELRNLSLIGPGIKTMANNSTHVYEDFSISEGQFTSANYQNLTVGDLTIQSGALFNMSTNSFFNIRGNWTNNGTFNANDGTVFFEGATTISGTSTSNFNHVLIGGSVTPTSTFNVRGNFTNNGSFTAGAGTVVFNGIATQSISGTAVTTFNNISVTNSSSAPAVQVQSNQYMTGVLTLSNNSVFDADGSSNDKIFTMLSSADDPTLDASIAALPLGASVTGQVTVQRYMSVEGNNNGRIYRYISSPVQNAAVSQIQAFIPVTGTFAGASSCSGCLTNQSMFSYDETVITDNNGSGAADSNDGYINFPFAANSETFSPGRGYAIYVRANIAPIAPFNSVVWSLRGPINSGNVNLPVTFTSSGTLSHDGWNLVGNPYPSTIDWDAAGWTRTNINNTTYMLDNGLGSPVYATHVAGGASTNGGSQYIATGQAFFVKSDGGLPVLQATESVKASGTQTTFFRTKGIEDIMRVTLRQGTKADETVIQFKADATTGFDENTDAHKLDNPTPMYSLATLTDGLRYVINALPVPTTITEVRLDITRTPVGNYTLEFTEFESFEDDLMPIRLRDDFLNTEIDIRDFPNYPFQVTSDARSFGNARFTIVFGNEVVTGLEPGDASHISVYPNPTKSIVGVEVRSDKDVYAKIVSLTGTTLFEQSLQGGHIRKGLFNLEDQTDGIYILIVQDGAKLFVKKILKKR